MVQSNPQTTSASMEGGEKENKERNQFKTFTLLPTPNANSSGDFIKFIKLGLIMGGSGRSWKQD